ncbi:MAG: hypothetical protein COA79_00970 [Planctomycetota bacterium]|nr:MAG: hypothetical protein COA79_00970 [Planctomycetota bacterium]
MSKKKILIIEDDETIQSLFAKSLEDAGYDIVCADDGQIGFDKAVTDEFDLIVTDLKMPNWSGLENIYGLKLVDCKAKIIVVSGYIDDKVKVTLAEYENIVGVFKKPLDVFDLIKKINEILK